MESYFNKKYILNFGKNKEKVEELEKFLSITNKNVKLNILFGVYDNDLFNYVSVCHCGNVETHNEKNLNCSCCNQELKDFSRYELEVNEDYYFSEVLQTDISSCDELKIDGKVYCEAEENFKIMIYQYLINLTKDGLEFIVNHNLSTEICKKNSGVEIDSDYTPLESHYYDMLHESYLDEGYETYNDLCPNYNELLVKIYDFLPEFKEFFEGHKLIDNWKNDIHYIIKALQLYTNCNKFSEINNTNSLLINFLINLKRSDKLAMDYIEFINNNIDNINLHSDLFNKYFPIYKKLEELLENFDFLIKLKENNLDEYLEHYSDKEIISNIDNLSELYKTTENVKFNDFIYYIVRGANNEKEKISNVIYDIMTLKRKGIKLDYKGVFKRSEYNRLLKLSNITNDNFKEILINASECKNFDEVYKLIFNN